MRNVSRQGGSVKVFIIVGVILTLIALGVLYGTKHFIAGQAPITSTPSQEVEEEASQPTAESPDASDSNQQSIDSETDNSDEVGGSDSDTSDSSSSGVAQDDNSSSSSQLGGESSTPSSQSYLPQTGPAENMTALAVALITASGVAYVRSLRHL